KTDNAQIITLSNGVVDYIYARLEAKVSNFDKLKDNDLLKVLQSLQKGIQEAIDDAKTTKKVDTSASTDSDKVVADVTWFGEKGFRICERGFDKDVVRTV
ncbi:MAG: hypothetical protein WC341_16310, partial [Bacteroidales bacterium]